MINISEADMLNTCEIFWAGDSIITFGKDMTQSVLGLAVRNPPVGYAIKPWIDNNECFLSYAGRSVLWWSVIYGSCDLYSGCGETFFDCFTFYNTQYVIVQLGVNDIALLSTDYEGSVDIAIMAAVALVQDIQALGKKVIWITNYPLDKDGLKDGALYEIPGNFTEGAGEFGQGAMTCTSVEGCRKCWNSNYEYFIDQLKPWCENNNIAFINVFQYIRDSYGDENTDDFVEAYSNDGVHIDYPGSESIYNYILAELETILTDDFDTDGIMDCGNDNCPYMCNPEQADSDNDNIGDLCDNCSTTPNPLQDDTYPPLGNGIGDACDCEGDFACDGDVDGSDAAVFKTHFGRSVLQRPCIGEDSCDGDFSCDGDVDGGDAAIFKQDYARCAFQNPCPGCVQGEWCTY